MDDDTMRHDLQTDDGTRIPPTRQGDVIVAAATYEQSPDDRWSDPGPEVVYGRSPRALGPWRDRVRWSAVWAGLLVTLSLYLVLQLTLIATGAVDPNDVDSGDAWLSAGAALIAFFIGGVTTGASALWDNVSDGVLHGVVMWSVGVVALLVLSVVASGLTLGAIDSSGLFDDLSADLEATIDDAEAPASADTEEAASWVLLGLGVAVVASVLGGAIGAKLWNGSVDDRTEVERRRTTRHV
jgi:hypothetical protein